MNKYLYKVIVQEQDQLVGFLNHEYADTERPRVRRKLEFLNHAAERAIDDAQRAMREGT